MFAGAGTETFGDGRYISIREPSRFPSPESQSTFANGVIDVVSIRAEEQMIGSHASGIVATMAYRKSFANRADLESIGHTSG